MVGVYPRAVLPPRMLSPSSGGCRPATVSARVGAETLRVMLANPDDHGTSTGDGVASAGEPGFLPSEPARRQSESALVRIVATAGIVGIGTALGAILGA